jgi:proline iminopeptidase
MAMRDLYPPIEPFDIRRVAVDDLHTLHVEQSGNPDGVPVVFLHGGPGSPWSPHTRRFFDPSHYRLIAFDQRGSWRSTPLGELRDNTTPHLIADIEHLRALFDIERWIVFGGSWGSALGLAYGEAHPERCMALVLRGIMLDEPDYLRWGFHESRAVHPQAWDLLVAAIPEDERNDLDAALERRMLDPDPAIHRPAIRGWMLQSDILGRTRHPDPELEGEDDEEDIALEVAGGQISMVYLTRHLFLEPGSLRDNAHRLADIPGVIIHGEEDFNCPPAHAWDLHKLWPRARYRSIPDAGHSCFDRNIRLALVEAMEDFKSLS